MFILVASMVYYTNEHSSAHGYCCLLRMIWDLILAIIVSSFSLITTYMFTRTYIHIGPHNIPLFLQKYFILFLKLSDIFWSNELKDKVQIHFVHSRCFKGVVILLIFSACMKKKVK